MRTRAEMRRACAFRSAAAEQSSDFYRCGVDEPKISTRGRHCAFNVLLPLAYRVNGSATRVFNIRSYHNSAADSDTLSGALSAGPNQCGKLEALGKDPTLGRFRPGSNYFVVNHRS